MNRKLNWVKDAFSREVVIMQDRQPVGGMRRDLIDNDVDAFLHDVRLRFDVQGFLFHSVNIHDLNANRQIIGHIQFSFGKRAELQLRSGENYRWKRHNVLMREWAVIRESPDGLPEKEIVSYDLTRKFFQDAGDIVVHDEEGTTSSSIVILTGLFIRNYFQRRRRMAAAAAAS